MKRTMINFFNRKSRERDRLFEKDPIYGYEQRMRQEILLELLRIKEGARVRDRVASRKEAPLMNILFVTGELFPWKIGGPQVVVYYLANELCKKGVKVHIFAASNRKVEEIHNYYNAGITLFLAKKISRERKTSLLDLMFSQIEFSSELVKMGNKFDIIHFQILPGARALLLPFISKLSHKKCVLTLHGWSPIEYKLYRRKLGRRIHWLFSRLNLNFVDHIVVNSKFMKKLVQTSNIKKSITIIPNGVNHKQWRIRKRARLVGEVNVFFWGKIWPAKGVDVLIKSFSEVLARTEANVHLYIAGSGPRLREYQELTRQLGIESKVHFCGFLPQKELAKYISVADFCVLPSVYEPFGIAILEAMSCKKLVIATNIGGISDIVKDGYNGILVPPNSVKKLAETMLYAIERRGSDKIKMITQNAYETARRFDWAGIADRYITMYKSLLHRKSE